MSRLPTRRKEDDFAIPAARNEDPEAGSGQMHFGWRVCIAVWVVAFAALVLYELGDFLIKAIRGMW